MFFLNVDKFGHIQNKCLSLSAGTFLAKQRTSEYLFSLCWFVSLNEFDIGLSLFFFKLCFLTERLRALYCSC